MARTKFAELRDTVVAKPGAVERLADLRVETLEEIRLHELRHGEAISQAELDQRLVPRRRVLRSATLFDERSGVHQTVLVVRSGERLGWGWTVCV